MGTRLTGKVAHVTAAGQGIGRATVAAFVREGARVWASDRSSDNVAALSRLEGVTARQMDVTDSAQVAAVTAEIGAVDVLVSAAGFVHHGTILDCDEAEYARSTAINVGGMYNVIRASLPAMLANGGGSIVTIASVVSSIKGAPNRFIYGTTKGAVIGLTKAIAADYIGQGIRCNAICPGTIDTPSLGDRIGAFADPDAARKAFIARQPMGRLGRADEVADLCVYLGSAESAFVTGAVMVIDGGMTL